MNREKLEAILKESQKNKSIMGTWLQVYVKEILEALLEEPNHE